MNEAMRHEIVQRHQAGASVRAIARDLGISRGAVVRVLARLQAQRDGPGHHATAAAAVQHRRSLRADLEGTARQLSEPHRRAGLAGVAAAGLHRRLHGGAVSGCGCCGRGPRRRPCRASRPGQASKPRWTMASTTSTSPAKAGAASTCSATCSATRGGSTCVWSSRWICRRPCASTSVPSIIWAAWPASVCTTTSRRWCSGTTPTARVQPEVPGLRHALRLPAAGVPRAAAANQGQSRTEVLLRRNQPAQRPHLRHAGTSQRGDGPVAARASPMSVACATSRNRRASAMSGSSPTCYRCPPPTSTRRWSSIATSTSRASSPIG